MRTLDPVAAMALVLSLTACGGSGDAGPTYALVIRSAELSAGPALGVNNLPPDGYALLKGEGFLPPGSRCAPEPNPFGFSDVSRFDEPGPNELTWTNMATSTSGSVRLLWNCVAAPTWSAYVPLAPGDNRIIVTMSAGPQVETSEVVLTRKPDAATSA